MKHFSLLCCFFAAIILSGCAADGADAASSAANASSSQAENHDGDMKGFDEVPEHAGEAMEADQDFEDFFHSFASKAGNVESIKGQIEFPYFYASFENRKVNKADFDSESNDRYIFQVISEREDAKISQVQGGSMNGYLYSNFKDTYGDLNDIYVADFEPNPTGYLVYFKLLGEEFKFIGCELIEIGD